MLTRPHNGFAACHYCGRCGRGCDTASFFNSADYLLPDALKTGKLEIRSQRRRRARAGRRQRAGERRAVLRPQHRRGASRSSARSSWSARAASTRRASCSTRIDTVSRTASATATTSSAAICASRCASTCAASCRSCTGRRRADDRGIGGEHIYMPRFNHRDGRSAITCAASACSSGTRAARARRRSLRRAAAGFRRGIQAEVRRNATRRGSRCTHTARCCRYATTA